MKAKNVKSRKRNNKGRKLTVTARITIWYAVFLFIISIALIALLFHLHNETIETAAETQLIKATDEISDIISQDGESFITDKKIRYYYKETYVSVYDENKVLIEGRRPRGIDQFPAINAEEIKTIQDDQGRDWYVYDTIVNISASGRKLYLRGMRSSITEEDGGSFELTLFLILVPSLLIVAALGGYLITRGAFAPVRDIIKTTEIIKRDGDLSRRIPLSGSRDEIYELSESFNGMFDRIEDMVKREKQFTSDVSHELRTPIAIIQSQSEYAMEDEEYSANAAEVINREAHRMSRLISNLLMISRSDAGRMVPKYSKVDVSDLIKEIASVKEIMAEEEGAVIETDAKDGIVIVTDEDMLAHIIANLVDNALKYGRHGGGIVRISAHIDGDELVLRVSDNGDGIKEEERDKIWERFYRSDSARTSRKSSGLGLAIVTAFLNALGARAELLPDDESELGGASFEIRVPTDEPEKESESDD